MIDWITDHFDREPPEGEDWEEMYADEVEEDDEDDDDE